MKKITAFAPATIANFNVGYDVLGLSLNNIGDEVTLSFNGTNENNIVKIINGDHLPKSIDQNCCAVVIQKMQATLGEFKGVDIVLKKGFKSGSGLGSSSASSAAAAYAFNAIMDSPFTTKELIAFAAEGEKIACGSPHIDNVAPALLGGIVLSISKKTNDIIQLPLIPNLYAVTFLPEIEINTADARKILKDTIDLPTFSKQVGLMAGFVASLYENNIPLFSTSLKDLVIEPMRSLLIPEFEVIKNKALQNGALAFGISGSGPSVFAIAIGKKNANLVQMALEKAYKNSAIKTQSYCNALIQESGARILNQEI